MIWRIPLGAREPLEMAASGVMVEKPSLRMRVAGGVSMFSRAGCMLGVSGAFKSKLWHARHLAEATRVPKSARIMKTIENIDLYNFAFFVSDGFSKLSRAVDELGSSGALQSMQNDLAHPTESARLPIEGCAVSYY